MTDSNVNPNGQVPWQQADANPTEPLNAMTAETGTAANNAPTQAIAAGEQPTQAFTPVEQPTQAFTPAEQPTQPFAPANQPVPPTQALPPVTPAAAPAPAPAAPNSPYPGAAPAGGSVPPVYGSVSAPVYPGGGAVPPQTPYNPYMQGGQPNGQPGWSGSYGSVPPEANQKYNGLAIAGFICSFLVSLLGLILSIVGLNQIKKQGGKGKGLAIAGIIISAAGMVIQVILVIALIVGGASYASKAIDEAKTDSFFELHVSLLQAIQTHDTHRAQSLSAHGLNAFSCGAAAGAYERTSFSMEQRISIERLEQAINLFGSFDENIRLIESEFHVTVANREGELRGSHLFDTNSGNSWYNPVTHVAMIIDPVAGKRSHNCCIKTLKLHNLTWKYTILTDTFCHDRIQKYGTPVRHPEIPFVNKWSKTPGRN